MATLTTENTTLKLELEQLKSVQDESSKDEANSSFSKVNCMGSLFYVIKRHIVGGKINYVPNEGCIAAF